MFPFVLNETERKMLLGSSDPAELRRRMLIDDGPENDYEISERDLLLVLRSLDADQLRDALQSFSDAEIEYLSGLMEAADD
jgi:hypothetical protein